MPPPRYQVVYTDITQPSFDHAQSVCEIFGTGLGTVLDQLDFDALNTTLKSINARDLCGERMFLGARSPGNNVWSWRTGEPVPNDWEHWYPTEPGEIGEACMRMGITSPHWMFDHYCVNDESEIKRFKCCICDTVR